MTHRQGMLQGGGEQRAGYFPERNMLRRRVGQRGEIPPYQYTQRKIFPYHHLQEQRQGTFPANIVSIQSVGGRGTDPATGPGLGQGAGQEGMEHDCPRSKRGVMSRGDLREEM